MLQHEATTLTDVSDIVLCPHAYLAWKSVLPPRVFSHDIDMSAYRKIVLLIDFSAGPFEEWGALFWGINRYAESCINRTKQFEIRLAPDRHLEQL